MNNYFFRLLFLLAFATTCHALPANFVYLSDVDPTIIQDIRYYSSNNFVGKPLDGYAAPRCILTQPAAQALHAVQEELRKQSLALNVFDCYRPQRAVDEFIAWSRDIHDQKMKQNYYPNINKADVFKLNYVAMKSGHSRGSTVDLTIVQLPDRKELNMGTHFDLLDPASHYLAANIAPSAQQHRRFLHERMLAAGFTPLETEWWHFTLEDEPFPDTYFNFSVR